MTGLRRTPRTARPRRCSSPAGYPDGSFTGAGSIELGLHPELVERLEPVSPSCLLRRRGAVAWYPAEVSVIASLHGCPADRCATPCCARCWTDERRGSHSCGGSLPLLAEAVAQRGSVRGDYHNSGMAQNFIESVTVQSSGPVGRDSLLVQRILRAWIAPRRRRSMTRGVRRVLSSFLISLAGSQQLEERLRRLEAAGAAGLADEFQAAVDRIRRRRGQQRRAEARAKAKELMRREGEQRRLAVSPGIGVRVASCEPEDQVDEIVDHYPEACGGCGREFDAEQRRPGGRFGRHQVAELPPISVIVDRASHPPVALPGLSRADQRPAAGRDRRARRSGRGCRRRW